MKIKTAEKYGLNIKEIAEFMNDFNKSIVIEKNYIAVIDNKTGLWIETFFPVKFKCKNCKETVADIEPTVMEFNTECPECKTERIIQ